MTTPATGLTVNTNDRDLAITPDGSRVVYVGNNGRDLFVRALDAVEPLRLFTGGPRAPFLSPDGQWVGFIDGGNLLKKVAIAGGPPVTIAVLDGNSRGATWASDDTIVFATLTTTTGLQQVPAAGGRTSVLTRPDRERGDFDHQWPEVLPGGQVVLFTVLPVSGGLEATQIMALDRRTGTQKVVVRGGTHAHYVGSGHIVYAVGNTLQAIVFDLGTLETRGTPVPILDDVMTTRGAAAGGMDAVVASDGTLAYVRGVGDAFANVTLAWVDRRGQETPIPVPPRGYSYPRISPDGSRVALWAVDQESDIWTWDFKRLTLTRLTFSSEIDLYPVWSPDGRTLLFASGQDGGTPNLFWRAADGTGAVDRLTRSTNTQLPTAISPDGSHLVFTETAPKTAEDVMQVEVTGSHTVAPLVQSSFSERNGTISPDGRWLAYEANDSGPFEIYVRPYPKVDGGRWQVSTGGGTRPLWSRNGEELFYLSPGGSIMGVGIERAASWAPTTPTTIVKAVYAPLGAFPGRTYDVASDGQRFLVFKSTIDPTSPPPQIVIVQHFDEMLKRLVPVK
jgi:serine/threonine-protein kinase